MHFYRDFVLVDAPEMSAIKQDILWSPHQVEKFISFGTDLRLYSFEEPKDGHSKTQTSHVTGTSGAKTAKLLSVNSDNQYLKCVCWYPKENYDNLLAVGLANGRVVLTSFNHNQDTCQLVGKEFIPRHARHCNALAWNPEETNLLAAGLDKHRTDYSLLIWDIYKSAPFMGDPERRSLSNTYDSGGLATKPNTEYGVSEIVHSLQWFSHQPKTLIAGLNHKHLKIYDIRDNTVIPSITTTKAVYGVTTDPFYTHRVASYIENQIMIWDIRNFEKPVVSLTDYRPIVKIAWCPTRMNLLATLSRDNSMLKLYDIQQTSIGSDEVEPTIVERSLQPVGQQPLISFCWHPSHENRIVTASSNNEFQNHIMCERITLNWSPSSTLVWSHGKKILQYIDQTDEVYGCFEDISVKMRQRALAGYGLEMQHLWKNGEFVKEDEQLHNLWIWLDLVKGMREEAKYRTALKGFSSAVGVHSLIRGDTAMNGGTNTRSDSSLRSWIDVGATAHIYKSPDRERALQLCGWTYDKDGLILDQFLDRLATDDQYERAAAIAVFNLKILKAIEILKKGATKSSRQGGNVSLSLVAMALSGYTGDRNSLWREMCDKMRSQLQDPYLRAMFAFLTCDNDSFEEVLNEQGGVSVQDRVAFACLFLPDNKLADFLDRLTQRMIESGNLDGMLLTGLCREGVDLLQRYVDLTGDIQTASHVVVQALPCSFEMDSRVNQWIESYRDLLDQWRLWHQRAKFDVNWHKVDSAWKSPQQVFISCNFCGKSISSFKDTTGRGRQYGKLGGTPNKSKFTCCPGCRKPLPRCALCLIHMGTPSGTIATKTTDEKIEKIQEQKFSTFAGWFTWCQSCRHGGHANHMASWFKDHLECPVTACNCKCMSLDAINRKEFGNSILAKPSGQ